MSYLTTTKMRLYFLKNNSRSEHRLLAKQDIAPNGRNMEKKYAVHNKLHIQSMQTNFTHSNNTKGVHKNVES